MLKRAKNVDYRKATFTRFSHHMTQSSTISPFFHCCQSQPVAQRPNRCLLRCYCQIVVVFSRLKRPTKKKKKKKKEAKPSAWCGCALFFVTPPPADRWKEECKMGKGRNAAHLCAPFIYFLLLRPPKSRGSENVSLIFSFLLSSSSLSFFFFFFFCLC